MTPQAIRQPVPYRYDLLYWPFIYYMAVIADYGAKKYGALSYQIPRLINDQSPTNHIAKHFSDYMNRSSFDHSELGSDPKWHLVSIAFNCMMEFWYEDNNVK